MNSLGKSLIIAMRLRPNPPPAMIPKVIDICQIEFVYELKNIPRLIRSTDKNRSKSSHQLEQLTVLMTYPKNYFCD
eukprot:TRINITY_DN12744_c0_g1_i1.p1 TRINITY_DN12744_c0_g1~~TRINITY_DN12744_c0_g1_i1.p1  ORF type:complete len:76 (-),score=4.08 TRINITY_DN12744_c0_g1_i1:421-648(-)